MRWGSCEGAQRRLNLMGEAKMELTAPLALFHHVLEGCLKNETLRLMPGLGDI